MDPRPIAQCAKCGTPLYGPDDHLVLIPAGSSPSDDIGIVPAFCERCYCAMGASGGRAKWERIQHPDHKWTCTCTYRGTYWDEQLSVECHACADDRPWWTNTKAFLLGTKKSTERAPSNVRWRLYNKMGRMVSRSPRLDAAELERLIDESIADGRIKRRE